MNAVAPPSFRPSGALPAAPLSPYTGPWNVRLAAHLLRRAGFGGTLADRTRVAASSMSVAVDAMLRVPAGAGVAPPALVDAESHPGGMRRMRGFAGRRGPDMPAAETTPAMATTRATHVPGLAPSLAFRKARAMARRAQDVANTTWWLDRMLTTENPLQEKMTLFLHGNFANAENQKGIYGLDMIEQNETLRAHAFGNFIALTHAMARDRAMLKYLDNARSERAHPNENFARELMELFTLGIGNYTEADVRESARAFTGYTFVRRTGAFVFNANKHDDGQKTFLGQTGNFTGDDVIDIIFQQPAAATFLAQKLLAFFVYDDPEPELVAGVAGLIRRERFELAPVLSMLFRSNVFYSDRAYRALVKSPVEFVIGSYQLFGIDRVQASAIPVLARMGQVPFHPPSVKGWDGGAQWLSTQTVLARENFASALMADAGGARGALLEGAPISARATAEKLVGGILLGDASPTSLAKLVAYLDGAGISANGMLSGENADERVRGAAYLTMAMPAYQLS